MEKRKIAVIGAGPMGLAVAYELAEQGYAPDLFEAASEIGGMTACFDFNGRRIERFYHFHCTSDFDFINMLDELGLTSKLKWRETKMSFWFDKKLQPWGNPIALLRFRGLSFIAKLRYGAFAFYCTKISAWEKFDGQRARAWVRSWVGQEAFDKLWNKLFYLKFYEMQDKLSAPWIWARVRRIGKSRYSIFREKLGYLEGGSDTFLREIERYLTAKGVSINLNSRINEVEVNNGEVTGIQINGQSLPYDTVISTIPLPFISSMIPGLPALDHEKYRALENVGVVCVIFKLRRAISDSFWVNVNDDNMDIPGFVEYSNLMPSQEKIVYVPYYMPTTHHKFTESDSNFLDKSRAYLMTINPSLSAEDFIEGVVSRYRWAQPVCGPNYLETLPPCDSSIKNLWIADTSHYYPEDRGISESIGFGRKLACQAINATK